MTTDLKRGTKPEQVDSSIASGKSSLDRLLPALTGFRETDRSAKESGERDRKLWYDKHTVKETSEDKAVIKNTIRWKSELSMNRKHTGEAIGTTNTHTHENINSLDQQ